MELLGQTRWLDVARNPHYGSGVVPVTIALPTSASYWLPRAQAVDLGCPLRRRECVSGPVGLPARSRQGDNGMGWEGAMTKALEDAFREAEKLPEAEQDQLAAAIRAEIEAETAWDAGLASSSEALATLADEALAEHRSGRTHPLDPDKR